MTHTLLVPRPARSLTMVQRVQNKVGHLTKNGIFQHSRLCDLVLVQDVPSRNNKWATFIHAKKEQLTNPQWRIVHKLILSGALDGIEFDTNDSDGKFLQCSLFCSFVLRRSRFNKYLGFRRYTLLRIPLDIRIALLQIHIFGQVYNLANTVFQPGAWFYKYLHFTNTLLQHIPKFDKHYLFANTFTYLTIPSLLQIIFSQSPPNLQAAIVRLLYSNYLGHHLLLSNHPRCVLQRLLSSTAPFLAHRFIQYKSAPTRWRRHKQPSVC